MTEITKKLLLTATATYCAAAAACTSFAVHPTVSETGRMLLQKCRDSRMGKLDASIRTTPQGVRWMQIGADGGAMFAMNDRGVAVTSNTGNKLEGRDLPRKAPKQRGSPFERIMETCSTAEEGIKLIETRFRNPAGIFMIADAKRAFLVEAGAGYGEHMEIAGGLFVVANEMHLPGIDKWNGAMMPGSQRQRAREANTRAALRRTRDRNGRYTRRGMFAASRNRCGAATRDQNVFRPVSKTGVCSLSAVCFEIDGEFPAYLSTAYIALGPQRHTVYLPCPMALEQFPEKFRDGSWAELAVTLRGRQGEANPLLPRIVALEDEMLTEYDRVRETARELLRAGKTAEARKLLNDLFAAHFARANALMTELAAAAPAAPAKR